MFEFHINVPGRDWRLRASDWPQDTFDIVTDQEKKTLCKFFDCVGYPYSVDDSF